MVLIRIGGAGARYLTNLLFLFCHVKKILLKQNLMFQYWTDYKAKIKKRVGALRASHVQTGGGPSTVNPLSNQETRFLEILGGDYGQGIPGVRVEPVRNRQL